VRKIVIGLAAAAIATAASTLSASAIHAALVAVAGLAAATSLALPLAAASLVGPRSHAPAASWGPVPSHSVATDLLSVTPALGVGLPSITAPSGIGLPSVIPSSGIDLPSVDLPSSVLPRVRVLRRPLRVWLLRLVRPPSVDSVGMAHTMGMLTSGKTNDCDQAGSPERHPGEPLRRTHIRRKLSAYQGALRRTAARVPFGVRHPPERRSSSLYCGPQISIGRAGSPATAICKAVHYQRLHHSSERFVERTPRPAPRDLAGDRRCDVRNRREQVTGAVERRPEFAIDLNSMSKHLR
jgi:hypothetical protein